MWGKHHHCLNFIDQENQNSKKGFLNVPHLELIAEGDMSWWWIIAKEVKIQFNLAWTFKVYFRQIVLRNKS